MLTGHEHGIPQNNEQCSDRDASPISRIQPTETIPRKMQPRGILAGGHKNDEAADDEKQINAH